VAHRLCSARLITQTRIKKEKKVKEKVKKKKDNGNNNGSERDNKVNKDK
jgi:hypothetical protein